MHFPVLVLIPRDTTDVWETVGRMLLPYFIEYGETAPRKEYVSAKAVENLAVRYHVRPTDVDKIAAKWKKDVQKSLKRHGLEFECGMDEQGLFHITTTNPQGKYDYWTIHDEEQDVWPVSVMPDRLAPEGIVTPTGVWHDIGDYGESHPTEEYLAEVRQRARELLAGFAAYLVVQVDCHI